MLTRLEIENFKCVESDTIDFTMGLNVLRGANEAGKTSRLQAVAYALWGARALPLSLEETVTWGKPVASLRVCLEFLLAGQAYRVVRSKSGAELTGEGVTASGQAEVTAFIERLTGANMRVGTATLLSSQNGLQGSLDGSAVALIEELSNMGLIDTLVGRIQDTLPCGNTKILESQLEGFIALVPPVLTEVDTTEQEAAVREATTKVSGLQQELADLSVQVKEEAKLLQVYLLESQAFEAWEGRVARLSGVQRPEPVVLQYSKEQCVAGLAAQQKHKATAAAYSKFLTAPPPELAMPLSAVQEALQGLETERTRLQGEKTRLAVQYAQTEAMGVYEDSCALCGKLLQDVPEVVEKNTRVEATLKSIESLQGLTNQKMVEAGDKLQLLVNVRAKAVKAAGISEQIAEYVERDVSVSPERLTWTGGVVGVEDGEDYARWAEVAERCERVYVITLAAYDRAQAELGEAGVKSKPVEPKNVYSVKYTETESALNLAYAELKAAEKSLGSKGNEAKTAVKLHEAACGTYKAAMRQKDELQKALKTYSFHNTLIKRLREARPQVARGLWSLVLSGVSYMFSQMRGVQSVVTRSDTRFLIDGKPVEAYSGSTKDILALAIRMTLQKTFMPNVDFCILDEPAAAMDAVRESDTIAAIARAGFTQSLLVTHSDLADTFSTNKIGV